MPCRFCRLPVNAEEVMECRHCMNPDSIISPETCCTGCCRLREKMHLCLEDTEIPVEEMEKYLSDTEKEILDKMTYAMD